MERRRNPAAFTTGSQPQTQLRSVIPPIIELIGKIQSLTAGVLTTIEWNEILRQTNDPLTSWRTTGNYIWPRFISPASGSTPTDVVIKVGGYYQFFLSTTVTTAAALTLNIRIYSTTGVLKQNMSMTFASQTHVFMTTTAYVEANDRVQCAISSPVTNLLIPTTQATSTDGTPSPRLIITQLAQFYDSSTTKMTRVGSDINTSVAANTAFTVDGFDYLPAAAATNPVDEWLYNAGGSNQLQAYHGSYTDRLYVPKSSVYLVNGRLLHQGNTTGTRVAWLASSNIGTIASYSLDPTTTANFISNNVTTIVDLTAGSYVQLRFIHSNSTSAALALQNGGLLSHTLSLTDLGTDSWSGPFIP